MKKQLYLLIFLFAFQASLLAQDTGIRFIHEEWQTALQQAREQDKIIFVDAYTTWCGPCKWMAKNTFTDEAVAKFYNEHFVNVKLDMEKGEGLEFAKQYGVRAYPTLLFIDKEGQLVHIGLGARPPEMFIELGEAALDPDRRVGELIRAYEQGERAPDFLRKYALAALDAGLPQAPQLVDEYLQTQDDWLTEENAELVIKGLQAVRYDRMTQSPLFTFVKDHLDELSPYHDRAELENMLFAGVLYSYPRGQRPDDATLEKAVEEVLPGKGAYFVARNRLFDLMRVQGGDNDERFMQAAIEFMKKYGEQADASLLNSLAWRFYELTDDPERLRIAHGWARRSVELDKNYFNMDTLAALCYKLKDKDEALRCAREAIELAKANGIDYESTEELIEKINQM